MHFWTDKYYCALVVKAKKSKQKSFQSLKVMMSASVVRKIQAKKSRSQTPKIQCLVTPPVLQPKHSQGSALKKHTKKNKEEAAEYAQLLAKRMKKAKEKQIVGASKSKFSQNQVFKTNK